VSAAIRADDAVVAELTAIEDRRRRAVVAVDLAELDAIFADDLVHIHSTGLTHDKPALLAHIERKRSFLAVERGQLDVRVCGDIAVMVGLVRNLMRTPDGGETVLEGVVTQVLRRDTDGWRFIHFQLTPYLAQESGR
jgi:ketosteroid isomerase-like protein